jgi:hypothetical protein
MKDFFNINNKWFYTDLNAILKLFTFFVKGDLIVLLPFVILLMLLGFLSLKFMMIMLGVYYAVRNLGEMIYWLLQQFGPKTYRPYDYGFKNLDNNAIYIIYQTMAICATTIGVGVVVWAVMFM